MSLEATNEPNLATELKAMTEQDSFKSASTRHVDTIKAYGCSRLSNQCPSGCCIDGQCVDSSQCEPVKAPRGGRGGGGRGGGGRGGGSRSRGSGGGHSGSANGGGSAKPWVIVVIIIGPILFVIVVIAIFYCWCGGEK